MSDAEIRDLVGALRSSGLSVRELGGVREAVLAAAKPVAATGGTTLLGSGLIKGLAMVAVIATAPLLPPEPAPPRALAPLVQHTSGRTAPRPGVWPTLEVAPRAAAAATRPQAAPIAPAWATTPPPPPPAEPPLLALNGPAAIAPPDELPPSEALADGIRRYARGEWAEAAAALLPVLEGRTADSLAGRQHAQLVLAKALFHLRLYHASAIVFDAITREGESHPAFEESLPWLAQLAEHLPEPTALIESIGRYRREQLSRLGRRLPAAQYDELLYLLGRDRYARRDLSGAIALFREVRPGSPRYVHARFFEGVSHVRLRRARPAVAAFREVTRAFDEGRAGDLDDAARLRDLAWLSLARVYYSAGRANGSPRVLGNAVDAWNRVPEDSEHWPDAIFEQAWALFVSGEHDRALGRVHALLSPYFEDRHYPEAYVLRAVALYQRCQLDASEQTVEAFHRKYDPVHGALRRTLARHGDPARAFSLLDAVRSGRASLDPRVARLVRSAFDDRELSRHLSEVRALSEEDARVAGLAAGKPHLEPVAAWLGQELAVARALAADRTGELAHLRLERLVDELGELMNQMDAVQLEIHTERRRRPQGYAAAEDDVTIVADQEHVVWPFRGEYWEDELPYYRVHVPGRCQR